MFVKAVLLSAVQIITNQVCVSCPTFCVQIISKLACVNCPNNNNDFISIALFHAKHAQLR